MVRFSCAASLDGRDEALKKRSEGALEARRERKLAEARKGLRKLRRGEREANAITEQKAEEEAKGIVTRAKAKGVCNDGAGIAEENPLINKMMINWAEKQAPEDRQAAEDVLDAMTQYGVEGQEKLLSSLRTKSKATGNLELLQAVTMLREDDGREAKETAETKGELSREGDA